MNKSVNTKGVEDGMGEHKCDCWKYSQQVCDICQGVGGADKAAAVPVESPEQPSMSTGGAAALHETIATLKEELTEMTKDRDLWQEAHDEDCPNKAMVETLRAELARERERHQEMTDLMREIRGEHDRLSQYDSCACWSCIRIDALLEPAPVATGEEKAGMA